MKFKDIVKFHGHECPGLAIGYRMTLAAMEHFSLKRSEDEELVAIVENDACGVDALQCLSGCTFGKGNLHFKDYGKQVYTIYSRLNKNGVRVAFNDAKIPPDIREDRNKFCQWLLKAPANDFLKITKVKISEPEPATIRQSIKCSTCNEKVMESRIKTVDGKPCCIPCSEK